jgi:hypothetical protein
MTHLVLLGDSIIDNGAYVGREPCVLDQVRDLLPSGWVVSQRAVDGHTSRDVLGQLTKLPAGVTHVCLSAGGNDALGALGVLGAQAANVGEGLLRLAAEVARFEASYRATLDAVLARSPRLAVCTIYNPRFDEASMQAAAVAGLAHYNDVILRAAFERGVAVIDLRLITTEASDYANAIEPSSRGGAKIARAIVRAATEHDYARGQSAVFVGQTHGATTR